jgi:hypothetical protein
MSDLSTHPLVDQLHFTRAEFRRGLRGTPETDGARRLEPMNSIGWRRAACSTPCPEPVRAGRSGPPSVE